MIVTKDTNGVLRIPKDIWTKKDGTLSRVKEIWTKNNGSLIQVFGGNVTTYTGNHPFWTYSLNSDFEEQDGAVPCWNTFWSINNAGTYLIGPSNSGRATVQIPLAAIVTTNVPETPATYNYTTDTRSIFTNTTAGDRFNIVTKNTDDLLPLEVTDVQTGAQVRWSISSTWTQPDTRVQSITNATTFVVNKQPTANTNGSTSNLSRTYASSINPATPAYTNYSGYCTFQSNYELRIADNTSYTITVNCVGGTTNNTTWKIGCLTGTSDGGAQFFAAGSNAFESPAYDVTGVQRSLTFTAPSGATRARPYIRVEYDSGTSGTLNTLPRQYSFEWIRFA